MSLNRLTVVFQLQVLDVCLDGWPRKLLILVVGCIWILGRNKLDVLMGLAGA